MTDQFVLKLGTDMVAIDIDPRPRFDLDDQILSGQRYPAFAISVTFVIEADTADNAKNVLYELTEHLHDESEIRSIYYGDEARPCEVDEHGDVYSDSFEGFPKT